MTAARSTASASRLPPDMTAFDCIALATAVSAIAFIAMAGSACAVLNWLDRKDEP